MLAANPMNRFQLFLVTVFGFLASLLFLYGCVVWHGMLIDDAFITFRFAENIANGHGVVWNIGEERVEGYSSPLMIFVLLPCFWLGADPLVYSQILAVLINWVMIPSLLLYGLKLSSISSGASPLRILPPMLAFSWLLLHGTVVHTLSGMETALTTGVYLSWAVLIGATCHKSSNAERLPASINWLQSHWGGFLTLLLASLCVFLVRSEGGAVACIGFLVAWLYSGKRWRSSALGAAFFGCVALYLIWKQFYFGHVLPTPYYHKVAPEGTLVPGLRMVIGFFHHYGFYGLWIFGVWLMVPPGREAPLRPLEAFSILTILFHAVFFCRVEHIMGYDFRFNWPSLPFILLLAVLAVRRLESLSLDWKLPQYGAWAKLAAVASVVALFFAFGLRYATIDAFRGIRYFWNPPKAQNFEISGYGANKRIGEALGSLELSYDTTVIGMEAGLIPYYARTRTIDEVGLTSLVFTHGTREEREAYLEANPFDVYFTVSTTGGLDDFAAGLDWVEQSPEEVAEWSRERFIRRAAGYYYAGHYYWWMDARRQQLILWVRKSHPRATEIVAALRNSANHVSPRQLRFGPYEEGVAEGVLHPTLDASILQ
jgi:arabinofuranosyltransferase